MIIRYTTAVTAGSFMTLSLFYVMQSLIAMGSMEPVVESEPHWVPWVRVIEDETTILDEFIKIDPIDLPPLPPTNTESIANDPIHVARVAPPIPGEGTSSALFSVFDDGPLIAVVRVQPTYPARAVQQELEGYVIVQFDVNTDGTVGNVQVLESSHRIFENAAIRAALRFRYKARVVDGTAQITYGVRNKFRFQMDRG